MEEAMRMRSMLLTAAAVGLLCASGARGEIYNGYDPLPSGGASEFTFVFQGNILSSINLTAMETDATVNPFYWLIVNMYFGVGSSTVTATLNGQGNTVITFTGVCGPSSVPCTLMPGQTNSSPGNPPHFGLDPSSSSPNGPTLTMLSQYWTNGSTQTSLPGVSTSAPSLGEGTVKYDIFFANVTQGGMTVGEWIEVPYTGTAPSFSPRLTTGGDGTLSNVGYFLSDTLIPLDNLNIQDYPPPGTDRSPFTATPQYDGNVSAPEPSTWAMMLVGFAALGLAGCFGSRKFAARVS
jgi:PEP-CTERM motif